MEGTERPRPTTSGCRGLRSARRMADAITAGSPRSESGRKRGQREGARPRPTRSTTSRSRWPMKFPTGRPFECARGHDAGGGSTGTASGSSAPRPIADLAAADSSAGLGRRHWTAPADLLPPGSTESTRVAAYDLRYATGPLDDQTWSRRPFIPRNPRGAGNGGELPPDRLTPGTLYHVGLRSRTPRETGVRSRIS